MRGWKLLFALAAAFNLAIGAAVLLAPQQFGIPDMTPAELLPIRAMGWFIAVFGVGYAIVATDPPRHRGLVQIGVVGKLGFVALMLVAWTSGLTTTAQFAPSLLDLLWAAAFILFLQRGRAA